MGKYGLIFVKVRAKHERFLAKMRALYGQNSSFCDFLHVQSVIELFSKQLNRALNVRLNHKKRAKSQQQKMGAIRAIFHKCLYIPAHLIMQYLLKFKTLIGYFIELNWPRIILNWIYYWIELAKNNFELNIFLNRILAFFFWLNISFELNPDNFLLNWKLNWIIFDSFLLNQKLNWIIFKRNSIIDWIVKLYLPWLVLTQPTTLIVSLFCNVTL